MSFGDVAAAAVDHARRGYTVLRHTAQVVRAYRKEFELFPSNAEIFMPHGEPIEEGTTLVLPKLAATLSYLVDQEKVYARGSRERGLDAVHAAFYRGDIAREIVRFQEAHGGLLAMDDLADFSSEVEEPLIGEWSGLRLHVGNTWCQGAALLQMCNMIDAAKLHQFGHNTPDYIDELASVATLALEDRDRFYGDPRAVVVPIANLLSKEHARKQRPAMQRTLPKIAATNHPFAAEHAFGGDTAQISVVDRFGNAVSATPSDPSYFGGPIVPRLGILASPRGLQSRADPSHPNGVAPGKRPRVTPSPVLATGPDGLLVPLGSPGSDVIVQALLHFLVNLRLFCLSPQAAVEAPRFASFDFESSAPPNARLPRSLSIERRLDPAVGEEMERHGYRVRWWPEYASLAGAVAAVVSDPTRGVMVAAVDPRRPTAAAGR